MLPSSGPVRPAPSRPRLTEAAAETPDGVLFVFSNYLLGFEGWKPAKLEDVGLFLHGCPGSTRARCRPATCPPRVWSPNSERYVLGPTGLERFEPGVPPSAAAFSMGAEVQIGQYDTRQAGCSWRCSSYPTPQIARQRLDAFSKLPGAMAKRAGPLVAVLLAPKDPNEAERLLARVKYNAVITENERSAHAPR